MEYKARKSDLDDGVQTALQISCTVTSIETIIKKQN